MLSFNPVVDGILSIVDDFDDVVISIRIGELKIKWIEDSDIIAIGDTNLYPNIVNFYRLVTIKPPLAAGMTINIGEDFIHKASKLYKKRDL